MIWREKCFDSLYMKGGIFLINVKNAVEAAISFAKYINEEEELDALRVEEVELSDDGEVWLVKLGWNDPGLLENKPPSAQLTNLTDQLPRIFKIFYVDAETGEINKMKNIN